MAVAGLHNVSAFGPSFFGESQPSMSTGWGDEPGRPSTRASSLLQMWRELEGDGAVNNPRSPRRQRDVSDLVCLSTSVSVGQGSDNGHDVSEIVETYNEQVAGSEMEHEDISSILSEQCSDLGEIERDRVRQIFREWMNSGSTCHSPSGLRLNSRSWPQWLGENERERVRIIREWVQMNAQQSENQESVRDGVAEAGPPIEQVRDGLAITHPEIGARRPIRRLCGRQTLLDLLLRAQCERRGELQGLLDQRPVSDFAHRNRIQALLRGRFLRNERLMLDKRPSSVAATELGFLRQRNTVSGLREEFLSKLDISTSPSLSSAEADASFSDTNNPCRESDLTEIHRLSDLGSTADANRSHHELGVPVTEVNDPNFPNDWNEQDMLLRIDGSQQAVSLDDGTACTGVEHVLDNETTGQELSDYAESVSRGHGEEIYTTVTNELALESEHTDSGGPSRAFHEHYELMSNESNFHEIARHTTELEGDTDEQFDLQDASARVDESRESVIVTEDNSWQNLNSGTFTRLTNNSREEDRNWEEASDNRLFQETSYNNVVDQESHEDWQGHDLQEAIDSWLDIPSAEVGESISRTLSYYFPDDDNTQSMELRELFSRRRVSSLLRSSFRESLDQVLQSHVERQIHVLENWDMDNASTPSLVEHDQGQQTVIQAFPLSDAADDNPFVPTSTLVTAFQPQWDDELQDENFPHNSSDQRLGMEWDVINELRIDMTRLQQRLNNMQSMLEACIDMQIELQRSVRQEVSAALNRSIQKTDADASKGNNFDEAAKWDYVRRGICCLCCHSSIDTLLYRCGHLCTCSKCAENLVQDKGKCPMCQAPVVEAVRAYFTH